MEWKPLTTKHKGYQNSFKVIEKNREIVKKIHKEAGILINKKNFPFKDKDGMATPKKTKFTLNIKN